MKFRTAIRLSAFILAVGAMSGNAFAMGRLAPQNFNKMYYLAAQGKIGILRHAVNRGLNIDSMNPNGDTGLCIAVKRKDYVAYNSFRMSGANPRHACTYRLGKTYREFLESNGAARPDRIVGNEKSLYYNESERAWWPWILGGAAVGGAIWASTGSSGGGSDYIPPQEDDTIRPVNPGYGLATLVNNYKYSANAQTVVNTLAKDVVNSNAAAYRDKISLLPNVLDNVDYLVSYMYVTGAGEFVNARGGDILLKDATVGATVSGKNSTAINEGSIDIEAKNGTIGLVASNGGQAFNGTADMEISNSDRYGQIDISFQGGKEGDAVVGMYADTQGKIVNYGKIIGATTEIVADGGSSDVSDEGDDLFGNIGITSDTNRTGYSRTILGMGLFDLYTGTNLSANTVTADNYGQILLTAGYNSATNVAVSLVGMGSYIDDNFLNGRSNPSFAEKMNLSNYGNISISYSGAYKVADTALKLGDGGLIGMRADAATTALNRGNITINLTSTAVTANSDVAAGQLVVHGGVLINGDAKNRYSESNMLAPGVIRIINGATSNGVSYGMLAAPGDGTQSRIYAWEKPKLYNYGLIDMMTSNSYAMASFAGGELINSGVINLGVENGDSYYTKVYGMFAAGSDVSDQAYVQNKGTINVNSTLSTALYNAFAGSVTLVNDGYIYLSSKATGSSAFGGNFSKAINNGSILYKVDNSKDFQFSEGRLGDIGFAVKPSLVAFVTNMSGNEETTAEKQNFVNNGRITLGQTQGFEDGVDYGGTYGTSVVNVSKQGSAENGSDGVIDLVQFDLDRPQFNAGMYVAEDTTASAFASNLGTINVDSVASVGIRNDSTGGGQARNLGEIYVNGNYSYGMAAQNMSSVWNGIYGSDDNTKSKIYVRGEGAVGIYLKDSNAFSYGNILLQGNKVSAYIMDGEKSTISGTGDIIYDQTAGYTDVAYFWLTNGARRTFTYDNQEINRYTLIKVTTSDSGGNATFKGSAHVTGVASSRLFYANGTGSAVSNLGKVTVDSGATAIEAVNGASASNSAAGSNEGTITVNGAGSKGMSASASDETSSVATLTNGVDAVINVNGGYGMYGGFLSQVYNYGQIKVSSGTGIYISGKSLNKQSSGQNLSSISVTGNGAVGVDVTGGAIFSNLDETSITASAPNCEGGNCDIEQYATGVKIAGAETVANYGNIKAGDNGIGVAVLTDGGFSNTGTITVAADTAYGIYASNAKSAVNAGEIKVNAGTGVYAASGNAGNDVHITVTGFGAKGMASATNGTIKNGGKISVVGGTGMYVEGLGDNTSTIEVSGGYGAWVNGGRFENNGSITGAGTGIYVTGGNAVNYNTIELVSGNGVKVVNGGTFTNAFKGEIQISGGNGIYVDGTGASAVNAGSIVLDGSGYGAYIVNGGHFTNNGTITFDSTKNGACTNVGEMGECIDAGKEEEAETEPDPEPETASLSTASLVYLDKGAFVNGGEVDFANVAVDFDEMKADENSAFVVADGGSYKAESFKGDVMAGKDIVMKGFDDVYVNEQAFVGKNEGLKVASESYMFTADVKDNGGTTDVELTRKGFDELIEDEEIANFFETNYALEHNEKIYNALKSATNSIGFRYATELETGEKFYANLPRENMAVLRGLNTIEQQRLLEDGLTGASVGVNYYRTGKDGVDGLSEYSDDVYSAYLGYGKKLNRQWSVGGVMRAAYVDAEYDEVSSSRDNQILLAFIPLLYQNGDFAFLTMPSVGAGYGTYKRRALSGTYEADTLDFYYGLYNHAEYSIDVKVAELVAEAELNLQGISMTEAKEDQGLILKANDSFSAEGGVGLKLRKRIQLAKKRSLMLAIGTKYYHEFADPYKNLMVTMGGSPVDFSLNGYHEDKNRLKTTAEAVYKDGDFAVAAEISHNAEKENNVEGGVGVRYSF